MPATAIEPVKQISLYYRNDSEGADKIYVVTIDEAEGGYHVNGWSGPRLGSRKQRPQTAGGPVSLERAEQLFAKLVQKKKTQRGSPYSEGAAAASFVPVDRSEVTNPDIGCLLLTAIEDSDEAVTIIRSKTFAVQEKLDGDRGQLVVETSGVTMFGREGRARGVSNLVASAAMAAAKRKGMFILDGEIIGEIFVAFDCLAFDNVDVRPRPMRERYDLLTKLLPAGHKQSGITLAETAFDHDAKIVMVQRLHENGAEGAVFKPSNAPYRIGRQRDHYKYKFWSTLTAVVIRKNEKDSVALGLFDNGQLVDMGNCKIRNSRMVVNEGDLVEVRYLNCNRPGGSLYQPLMLQVRTDIPASDCVIGQVHYKGGRRTTGA